MISTFHRLKSLLLKGSLIWSRDPKVSLIKIFAVSHTIERVLNISFNLSHKICEWRKKNPQMNGFESDRRPTFYDPPCLSHGNSHLIWLFGSGEDPTKKTWTKDTHLVHSCTDSIKINRPGHSLRMYWPNFWQPIAHVQQNIFEKTNIEVCCPHLYASFGTT